MDDERLMDLLAMEVGRNSGRPHRPQKKRGRLRRSIRAIASRVAAVCLAMYLWLAWRLWKRRLVKRGRLRWQKLAGIGALNTYESFMRPELVGFIYPNGYLMPPGIRSTDGQSNR